MKNTNGSKRTLLLSVLMSSPGPLIVGISLITGKSSTQLADFIRRTIELLAIILSFIVYCITVKDDKVDEIKKQKLEKGANIFVSVAMVLSGIVMTFLALFSTDTDQGNVIPGLIIALMSVTANSLFWVKYTKLGQAENSKILILQSKLYRAKTFVDASVVITLSTVLLSTNVLVEHYFDMVGTLCVSAYLIFTGAQTLIKELKKNEVDV